MRRALPLVLSLAAALPLPVNAAEPPATRRPWPRGTLMPSLALGASVLVDRPGGTLQLSGGLSYFVVDHLALGLSLRSSTSFLVEYVRTYHPGVEKQIATHEFSVTPVVTVVPHRGYLISPFIGVGVGLGWVAAISAPPDLVASVVVPWASIVAVGVVWWLLGGGWAFLLAVALLAAGGVWLLRKR